VVLDVKEGPTLAGFLSLWEANQGAAVALFLAVARDLGPRLAHRFDLPPDVLADIQQDVFLAARKDEFAAFRRKDPSRRLAAWYWVTARHLAMDRLRRRRRRWLAEGAYARAHAQRIGETRERDDATTEDLLLPDPTDALALLERGLDLLTKKQREAIVPWLAKVPIPQIARAFGIHARSVSDRIDSGLRRLLRLARRGKGPAGAPPLTAAREKPHRAR
jgi:RNA polymerase sigma factor (sigma-70 family)